MIDDDSSSTFSIEASILLTRIHAEPRLKSLSVHAHYQITAERILIRSYFRESETLQPWIDRASCRPTIDFNL